MSQGTSIQIQAVLFQNDLAELQRALEAVEAAAKAAKQENIQVSLRWGDASPEKMFTESVWNRIREDYPALSDMEYRWFGENTGYGKGNNLLAQGAKTDYLLIMNPEILLCPHAIIDLLAPLSDPQVGLVEARQIPVEHPKAFDLETKETEWASGACFLIPTSFFQVLNGFDTEIFFMYCEDVDLSWRVRMAGKKLYYQTLAGVYHARRLSGAAKHQAAATEAQYSLISEALLAYKWGYEAYAKERIQMAVDRGDPGSKEAAEEFQRRAQQGTLPAIMDEEHRIAHITQEKKTGTLYFTQHRYGL